MNTVNFVADVHVPPSAKWVWELMVTAWVHHERLQDQKQEFQSADSPWLPATLKQFSSPLTWLK